MRKKRAWRIGPGPAAIVLLALAWALTMHDMGWGQLANFAQVRAMDDGQAQIDPWHWETKDKAYIEGHFYSVKAPGLAMLTLPLYSGLEAAGAQELSAEAAANARGAPEPKWSMQARLPYAEYGFDGERAAEVGERIESETPLVWALTLLGAVLPALALLFGVRWAADRLVPGFGTAAAITLGLATLVMTFAAEYFPHVAAAGLGFGAFAVLMYEREGQGDLRLVGLAGLMAGLAVTFEYPLGLVGLILLTYALSRSARLPRVLAYGAAGVMGALPVLLFNLWAFGAPLEFAYGSAVAEQGTSGHAILGLNDDGLFGITVPKPGAALDLLFAGRGIVTLTPILLLGVVGAAFLRRDGRRAEANVILAVAAAYFVYNSGYWLPFGGGTPGPRFLIPAMPFLALGIAAAWRRLPALSLGLATPSALFMVSAAMTFPLVGDNGTGMWAEQLARGDLEHTVLTVAGVSDPWLAAAPVVLALVGAAVLAARATPLESVGSIGSALCVLGAWAVLSALGPTLAGDEVTPLAGGTPALALIGAAVLLAVLSLLALRRARSEAQRGGVRSLRPEPAGGEPSS